MAANWQRAASGLRAGFRWFTGGQSSRVSFSFPRRGRTGASAALRLPLHPIWGAFLINAHRVYVPRSSLPAAGGGIAGKGGRLSLPVQREVSYGGTVYREGLQCSMELWQLLGWWLGIRLSLSQLLSWSSTHQSTPGATEDYSVPLTTRGECVCVHPYIHQCVHQ